MSHLRSSLPHPGDESPPENSRPSPGQSGRYRCLAQVYLTPKTLAMIQYCRAEGAFAFWPQRPSLFANDESSLFCGPKSVLSSDTATSFTTVVVVWWWWWLDATVWWGKCVMDTLSSPTSGLAKRGRAWLRCSRNHDRPEISRTRSARIKLII